MCERYYKGLYFGANKPIHDSHNKLELAKFK
jgi:hypothetical protein